MIDLRKEFEKLQDIKDILEDFDIYYSNESDMYVGRKIVSDDSVFYPSWEVTFLNGAWYAFQEAKK